MPAARVCPLCQRPSARASRTIISFPAPTKGRETVAVHPICHRKIHSVLTERELKDAFHTIPALRAHPDIATFLKWIAAKDPDFHESTATSRVLKEKRGARRR